MWPFDNRKKFVQSLGKLYPKTPDIAQLENQKYTLVFAADDLMKPHKNYELIAGKSQPVSRGFTREAFDYRIGRYTGRGLPFADKKGLKVKGQIHAVETQHIPTLDKHYNNGVEFARVKTSIIVTDKEHRLMSIGSEEFLKHLPPGMIRTVPELGLRHYTSNPRVCLIEAHMYVALRKYWNDDDKSWLRIPPTFPKNELVWLPKYYKYPIERNRQAVP